VLARLIVGLFKGLLVGVLVGYGLAAAGLTATWLAYIAAVVMGMLLALVAGKPIWAKDARIEVGMKAAAGAVIAPLLLLAVRSLIHVGLPFDPTSLPGLASLSAEGLTLGTFSVTAFAMVAAALAAFYDADNSPTPESQATASGKGATKSNPQRIEAGAPNLNVEDDVDAAESESVQQKRRS
jgi:hypothetical protein